MKDTKSILLLMLSAGLVTTWTYHLYDKTNYTKKLRTVFVKDSAAVAEGIQDSLHKIYSATIHALDTELDSSKLKTGELRTQLEVKLGEIGKLRTEISGLLQNSTKRSDLELARQKISALQVLVKQLREQNTTMEEERQQLTSILDQLNGQVKDLETNMMRLDRENRDMAEKINLASTFVASEVQIGAVNMKGSRDIPTASAQKADKLIVSFSLKNNINNYDAAEVITVITDPNGDVIQNTMWESGVFDSKTEGRKKFTRKNKFPYNKGETERILFSMDAGKYLKGDYILQVYHNGFLIGQSVERLN